MALSVKLDPEDIPSILSILGIGGLPKQASDSGGSDDFAASGGVATHPGFGGGGDGQVYQPDVNYSEARANTDAQGMSNNPPPIDPSLGGSGDPTAQPSSTISMIAGRNSAPPPVQTQAPATTKLDQLRNFLNPQAGQPQPQNLDDALMSPAGQEPIVPRRSLSDVFAGRPAVAPPQTWVQKHPTASKVLGSVANFVQDASAGVGATTFGEGAQAAVQSGQRRRALALQNAKSTADIAHTQAETQAILNPPGKPNATQLEFDKAGNLIGFRDQRGNLIGPNNANLTPDQKSMLDAAEGRATAAGTPEAQVMGYLVKSGKTPAEAYQFIKEAQQNVKPDTATQNKQQFQGIVAKLAKEGGDALDGSVFTDPRKLVTAIQRSKTLTPDEKDSAQSYIATNTTPANQILVGDQRASAYGQTRQYSVLDTKNGNRPIYVSADELNKDRTDGTNRYVASGVAVPALNKENLMEDIRGGIQQVRSSLQDPNMQEFTTGQAAKIAYAMRERDPKSAISSLLTSGDLGSMTPEQENYLIAHSILAEQAMAMRSVLGAGQGSDDLRSAITATFPGPTTPSKRYGLKQLDAFESTVNRLERGIPNVSLKPLAGNSGGSSLTGPITPDETSKGLTAAGPGGHTLVFRGGKWIDPNTGVEAK